MSSEAAVYHTDNRALDRSAWLARRRQGIGGSDAAAVVGQSPWKSPLALWSEKVGLVKDEDLDGLEYIEFGKLLEPAVATKYQRVTKRELIEYGEFHVFQSPRYPWMFATIDRGIAAIDERGEGDLSIKTTGGWHAQDWDEEPPLLAQIQLQHELVVRGLKWGSFAVLIGGQRFRWCDVERNERFCAYLVEKEEEFWDRVQREDPPPVDASESSTEILKRLFPTDTGESVGLPPEALEWDRELVEVKESIKKLEAKKDGLENQFKALIGTASLGLLPNGGGYSWKSSPRAGYTVAPTTVRPLRRIKK